MEKYPPYQSIFAKMSYGESQMLDKAFYEEEVKRLCLAFEQQVCVPVIEQEKCPLLVPLEVVIYGIWKISIPDYISMILCCVTNNCCILILVDYS